MNPMILSRIENAMQGFVMEYLNLLNPEVLMREAPYYELVINKEKNWLFAILGGDTNANAPDLDWSVGFLVDEPNFFRLYSFDAYEPQTTFIPTNWYTEGFQMMLNFINENDLLYALTNPDGIIRHRFPAIPDGQTASGNFWNTSWKYEYDRTEY